MANLSQLTLPVKDTITGQVTQQTFNLSGGGGSDAANFVGTLAQWEALTQSEKDEYDSVDLIDDYYDVTDEIDNLDTRITDVETSIDTFQKDIATGITYLGAVQTGKMVTLNTQSNGIAGITTSGIQLPTTLYPKQSVRTACIYLSGGNWIVGWLQITSAGKLSLYSNNSAGVIVAADNICFTISYELLNP